MIYFTTDPHYCHDREFIYSQRGFTSMQQHDYILSQAIAETVKADDILYILGDIAWSKPVEHLNALAESIGNIIVILGNHDEDLFQKRNKLYSNVKLIQGFLDTKIEKQKVTLSHFPMLSWESSHHGAWHLYGHLHNREIPINGKLFDVAPTKDHMQPYSFNEIIEIMNNKPNNWDYIQR